MSHEDVSGFHRLESEFCTILRVFQCLKHLQLLIRKMVLKQEVAWVCVFRLAKLLSVDVPVRERARARACGSSLAVIDGLLSFFAPADPVFTLRHPNVPAEPAACWRSSEEKTARRARRRAFCLLKKRATWKSILTVLFLFSRTLKFFPRGNHLKLLKSSELFSPMQSLFLLALWIECIAVSRSFSPYLH